MTDTSSSPGLGARVTPPATRRPRSEPTGWVGWVVFAAVIMIMIGILHAIEGFLALFRDTYYYVASSGLVINVDYTGWGWFHLIVGLLVAGAGAALLTGRTWARVVGVLVAVVSIVGNFGFSSAYPLWSLTLIVLDVLVIYALTVHGGEMREI